MCRRTQADRLPIRSSTLHIRVSFSPFVIRSSLEPTPFEVPPSTICLPPLIKCVLCYNTASSIPKTFNGAVV